MQSYKCDKCGAELILNNEIQFTKCLFCGNSIAIIKDNEIRLNIKEIIPFSIEKSYIKVVHNFIILLVLKFDSHKSNRLDVMLFTRSVTEFRDCYSCLS